MKLLFFLKVYLLLEKERENQKRTMLKYSSLRARRATEKKAAKMIVVFRLKKEKKGFTILDLLMYVDLESTIYIYPPKLCSHSSQPLFFFCLYFFLSHQAQIRSL